MLRFRVGPQAEGILLLRPGVAEMQELPVVPAYTTVFRRRPGALAIIVVETEQLSIWRTPHCWVILALPLVPSLSLATPLATITALLFSLVSRLTAAALLRWLALEQLLAQLVQGLPV